MDPTRRRWWDGEKWTTNVAQPVTQPALPVSTGPTMGDGTTLPYAADAYRDPGTGLATVEEPEHDEPAARISRVRVLQMAVALVAILATGAVVFFGGDDEAAPPATTFVPATVTTPPTTETTTTTTTTTEPEPATAPDPEVEPEVEVEAPSYRDAYDACQAVLDDSSIADGGRIDYQIFRDIEAVVDAGITELRFEATDPSGATEAYLCRTLYDGDDVMVGRLYLDLQNALG